MSGVLHRGLAPLLAGGGTPERLAATSGELRGRIERLLWAPLPHLLDEDILAPLTAPPGPGDTLEAVVARLTGEVAESEIAAAGTPIRASSAAPPPLPADIATHARAAAQPAVRGERPRGESSPVADLRPPDAAANASEPAAGDHPIHSMPIGGRDWQRQAARLGTERPLSIAAGPPALSAPSSDPGTTDAYPASRQIRPVPGIDATVVADPANPSAVPRTGSTVSTAGSQRPAAGAAGGERKASGLRPTPPIRRGVPIAGAAGAARDGLRGRAPAESAAHRPRPPAFTVPEDVRVSGFAGLAALGRAASPGTVPEGVRVSGFAGLAALGRAASPGTVPADPAPSAAPSPPPARTGAGAVASTGTATGDRPPPLEARAVIAELADMLRLEVVAAGIDLPGRRS